MIRRGHDGGSGLPVTFCALTWVVATRVCSFRDDLFSCYIYYVLFPECMCYAMKIEIEKQGQKDKKKEKEKKGKEKPGQGLVVAEREGRNLETCYLGRRYF